MISRVNLRSREMVVSAPESVDEFVADWELQYSHCATCDANYSHRLVIREHRQVLPGFDDNLPTLWVIPGGDTSPAGRFGWREVASFLTIPHARHPHYHRKSEKDLLLLVGAGELKEIPTRRYLNADLWPSATHQDVRRPRWTGVVGYLEESRSTVYLAVGAEFLPLPEYTVRETEHLRCAEARRTESFQVGCTTVQIYRGELGTEVRVGDWACPVLPVSMYEAWVGTPAEFEQCGRIAPCSVADLDRFYGELLDGFDSRGIALFAGGEYADNGEGDWISSGWVAFCHLPETDSRPVEEV